MSSIATTTTAIRGQVSPRVRGFLLGFGMMLAVALVAATAIAVTIGIANSGRVLPNVRVGDIALGGLDRDAAVARLQAHLPAIDQGTVSLMVGPEHAAVTYGEIGRRYDVAAMADAAYRTGRSEGPVGLVIARLRDWLSGSSLPLVVHAYDTAAMDAIVARTTAAATLDPVDAVIVPTANGQFVVSTARTGTSVDAASIRQLLGTALARAEPGDQVVDVPVTERQPFVSTVAVQVAADMANRMAGDGLQLTAGTDRFSLSPAQVAGVISFQTDGSGTVVPVVNDSMLKAAVAGLAKKVDRPAKDASYVWGARITVTAAVEGRAIDQAATASAVKSVLQARAIGSATSGPMQLSVSVTQPKFTTQAAQAAAPRIVRIGSWTTYYHPGISNGFGLNISIPAQALNGRVVAPGATFDFWRDIGPVTLARGYRYGGAIINGKSEETGALAGGICSTSTTMFNAALRAGLQMGERMNHYYYISRYPVGLDATVFQDVGGVTDMTWTNDTPYPILIRAVTAFGIVRFDLYSVPTGRTVTLTRPIITNRVPARLYAGFDALVFRYVRDAKGNLIHSDRYFSHYHAVNS